LSGGKPKARDQSSDKFLQRIAGKKALVPPPTPRPVIGEHPVRTLMRENADAVESAGAERLAAETLVAVESPPEATSAATAQPPPKHASPAPPSVVDATTPVAAHAEKVRPPQIAAPTSARRTRPEGEDGAPNSAGAEERVLAIRKKYRLNRGEFALYRELYLMTHAAGKAECSFVVSELVQATGMLERRVRDNLRRLKKNGWLVLVEAYDFEHREKARYRVNVEPGV
jgi:hypothetical protein